MSTRCMIKFISPFKKIGKMTTREVVLYHHHDGYPTGVGLGLMDFIKTLREEKEKYPKSTPDCDGELRKLIESDSDYEITFWNHSDIEYYYTVDLSKLKVYIETAEWEDNKKVTKNKMDMDKLIKISMKTGNKNLDEIYWEKFHKEE